jgi:molybdopterin-containing oxidoreductase family iron-sulfur binding subunit
MKDQLLMIRSPRSGAGIPAAGESAALGRREFMRLVGFTVGATALTGCVRMPEQGVMPYLIRPEEVTPGLPYWYASVCGGCAAGCGILAKARDGRPIKLEGNPGHPISGGGLCAVGQASVLGLYDSRRLGHPLMDGKGASWEQIDREIIAALDGIRRSGGAVRFLTDSLTGPTDRERIAAFLTSFADGRHVIYDPLSASAIAEAHHATHGLRLMPRYRFDLAREIVGVEADFLGTWISPVEHTRGYRAGRMLDDGGGSFSHHVQLESRMTLTGGNADRRITAPAGSSALILAHLAGELASLSRSLPPWSSLPASPVDVAEIEEIARRLWRAPRGRTLVVCGDNDVQAQKLANYANHLLGNYGRTDGTTTLDLESPSHQRTGDDTELKALLEEMDSGRVDALFIRGGNPVYDLPGGRRIAGSLGKAGLVVSFAEREDESAASARFVCPEPHFLEAWGDSEPVAGHLSVRQPAIRRVGSTREMTESLAAWSGQNATAWEILRDSWREQVHPRSGSPESFDAFWNRSLHDGFVRVGRRADDPGPPSPDRFSSAGVTPPAPWSEPSGDELLLALHPSAAMTDGRHAHNAWLHELPDPITRTVWDNFACLPSSVAGRMGVETGDVVRITPAGPPAVDDSESIELPALVQPGQQEQTLSICLGYGRKGTDRFAGIGPSWWEGRPTVEAGSPVGVNAAPLLAWKERSILYAGRTVVVQKTAERRDVAATQQHHSLTLPEGLASGEESHRPIVQETTLSAWRRDPRAGAHEHHELASLWPDHPKSPHHWGMAIDLTACTGCSACVISCQAENNVPVVGKDEVRRAREMHWIRIDRYYKGTGPDVDVVHMPMMCQHCDNAPCETVCPVQATAQSSEGLNQQIYNRCVGTRYCANNCPYKVRRFNWFEYPKDDPLQNLALNPDVTVRSRGVMEKCSMCVQRIHDARAEAKREGRPIRDGEIQPACAQSCPAGAITFGDMLDPASGLSARKNDPRHFVVLAETGVKPVVGYLTRVRNREDAHGETHS